MGKVKMFPLTVRLSNVVIPPGQVECWGSFPMNCVQLAGAATASVHTGKWQQERDRPGGDQRHT